MTKSVADACLKQDGEEEKNILYDKSSYDVPIKNVSWLLSLGKSFVVNYID